jgi:enoyl-CoA hydratase/carnithine racemase
MTPKRLAAGTALPVIATGNGHAYAGGSEAMLICDFADAVRGACFALTEGAIDHAGRHADSATARLVSSVARRSS